MSFIMHHELVNFDLSSVCNLHGGHIQVYIRIYIPAYACIYVLCIYNGIYVYSYRIELMHKMHHIFIINVTAFSCCSPLTFNSLVISIHTLILWFEIYDDLKVHFQLLNSSISLIIQIFFETFRVSDIILLNYCKIQRYA